MLPDGLHTRPLTTEDVDDTVAMVNACELHDSGELMLERADLLADSRTVGFDLDRDWIGVFEGERIVGLGLFVHPRAWIDVHPAARGRGIGSWLRRWSEDRAREVGADRIGQAIEDRRIDATALLRHAGYAPRRTSWILRMDHPEPPPAPAPPGGIRLRPFEPGDEDEALMMFERAFSEWEDRVANAPGTWRAMVTEREGFQPDDLLLAIAGDRIVGGAFLIDVDELWVDKLAVEREFRHRGIARALLQTAFARSFERGYRWTSLSTDSNTGALSLYERVGMRIHRSFTLLSVDLR
ncbi:MAG TPA: GNAT family N-acetyltransferase [Actinomycetota bacterium]|nr:GNAT family N-acetyltransferase [Actinomycetota bacterium]